MFLDLIGSKLHGLYSNLAFIKHDPAYQVASTCYNLKKKKAASFIFWITEGFLDDEIKEERCANVPYYRFTSLQTQLSLFDQQVQLIYWLESYALLWIQDNQKRSTSCFWVIASGNICMTILLGGKHSSKILAVGLKRVGSRQVMLISSNTTSKTICTLLRSTNLKCWITRSGKRLLKHTQVFRDNGNIFFRIVVILYQLQAYPQAPNSNILVRWVFFKKKRA